MIINYQSPKAATLELESEGVLCVSGDIVVGDGGNAFEEE
jgi:hypothetical protein